MTPSNKHAIRALAVAASILGASFVLTGRMADFRGDDAFDFRSLGNDQVIVDFALTRRQIGLLAFGYLEKFGVRPEIGFFGNHQIQLFSSGSFDQSKDSGYFFNYWYAQLSLIELRDQLFYLLEKDLLPTKLALVQITTPNNDNGDVILLRGGVGNELPIDIREFARTEYPGDGSALHLDLTALEKLARASLRSVAPTETR